MSFSELSKNVVYGRIQSTFLVSVMKISNLKDGGTFFSFGHVVGSGGRLMGDIIYSGVFFQSRSLRDLKFIPLFSKEFSS
jgi:hypothetical protein